MHCRAAGPIALARKGGGSGAQLAAQFVHGQAAHAVVAVQPVEPVANFAGKFFYSGGVGQVGGATGHHFGRMPGQRKNTPAARRIQFGDGAHGPQGMVDRQQGQRSPRFEAGTGLGC